ncbi:NupC/NupG family nucleoside CNT transporter [Ruania albidiflava]|uniref:NupC/NupG family nucleoside CNT transporter n=1 Tax=Ruania albidiflava TaxID=366586 RepID=UPI0003B6F1E0|nr:nucleoside transporter C-terminal domain-containing protein [Ruania albidiflava]
MDLIGVLRGIGGVVAVLAIAFLFSKKKREIRVRPVLGGLGLLLLFAFLILGTKIGQRFFGIVVDGVTALMDHAAEGIDFLFGGLYTEESGITFVVAFNVLPHIIFFAGLIAVLYHLRVMQFLTKHLGGAIAWILGTSRAESLAAAGNIFVGHTEAPLIIRPYLSRLTTSEIFTVMTCGLASSAGTMLASYIALGVSPNFVLGAMFMAPAAGIVLAKVFHPETEEIQGTDELTAAKEERDANVVDAAASGANRGLQLALTVGAILLTFVALIAVLNGAVGAVGGWFGLENLTLQQILGYALAPLAFALGVPWSEATIAGSFFGEKFILTEFIAYTSFIEVKEQLSAKTVAIVSIALCGFANLGSMGSLMGVLSKLLPERGKEFARLALRSVFAGTLASMLSAAVVGMFV